MKQIFTTTLILTVMLAPAIAGEIVLNDTVEAGCRFVRFSDVATVVGVSQEELVRINDIFCGPAPEIGKIREVTSDYLKMRLRQSGFNPADFTFSGTGAVKLKTVVVIDLPLTADLDKCEGAEPVEAKTTPVKKQAADLTEKIEAAVLEFATGELGVDSADLAVKIGRLSKALKGLGESARVMSVKPTRDINGRGKVTFSVEVRDGERKVHSAVIVEIGRHMEVAVAAENIPADVVLTEGMIAMKRVFVSSDTSDYFTSPQDLAGLKTKRSVSAGRMLSGGIVEKPVLVKRNDVVKVVVRIAGTTTTVEANARAGQNGHMGDFIKVTNTDSRKTFLAEIIGPRRVQVVLGEE